MRHVFPARFDPYAAGILSAAIYLVFRLVMHFIILSQGLSPTGLLQYDSYYFFSFARELNRAGNWIFFQNPFGSLDSEPGLFSGVASFLNLIRPLWEKNLLAFDLVFAGGFSFLNGMAFAKVLLFVSNQRRRINWYLILFSFLSGGIGFITTSLFDPERLAKQIRASYWGVSWTMNNFSTFEIAYHALFWLGVYGLLTRKTVWILICSSLLALLHPFTSVIFLLAVLFITFFQWKESQTLSRRQVFARATAALILILGAFYYAIALPEFSKDAVFLGQAYRQHSFSIAKLTTLEFLTPTLLIFLIFFLPGNFRYLKTSIALPFVSLAAVLIFFSFGNDWGHYIPQPAHWMRFYPIGSLVIGAAAFRRLECCKFIQRILPIILFIGLVDSALNLKAVLDRMLSVNYPSVVNHDSAALLEYLSKQNSKTVAVVRSCQANRDFPGLEYAMSSLTDLRVPFGHVYFSPSFSRHLEICSDSDVREKWDSFDILVFHRGLSEKLHLHPTEVFGEYEVVFRKDRF